MKKWKESENKAFNWFRKNIDSIAEHRGGEDSSCGDIYSPKYNSFIEVKDITNGARCGQFTEGTIKNNPYAQAIYDGIKETNVLQDFISYHYSKKNVTHFIIIDNDDISFYTLKDFLKDFVFEVQAPYAKRSGTRSAPKKDINILLKADSDFFLVDGVVYCKDKKRWNQYFSLINTFDYFISAKKNGELRKRSATKNMTWHLVIKRTNNGRDES